MPSVLVVGVDTLDIMRRYDLWLATQADPRCRCEACGAALVRGCCVLARTCGRHNAAALSKLYQEAAEGYCPTCRAVGDQPCDWPGDVMPGDIHETRQAWIARARRVRHQIEGRRARVKDKTSEPSRQLALWTSAKGAGDG